MKETEASDELNSSADLLPTFNHEGNAMTTNLLPTENYPVAVTVIHEEKKRNAKYPLKSASNKRTLQFFRNSAPYNVIDSSTASFDNGRGKLIVLGATVYDLGLAPFPTDETPVALEVEAEFETESNTTAVAVVESKAFKKIAKRDALKMNKNRLHLELAERGIEFTPDLTNKVLCEKLFDFQETQGN